MAGNKTFHDVMSKFLQKEVEELKERLYERMKTKKENFEIDSQKKIGCLEVKLDNIKEEERQTTQRVFTFMSRPSIESASTSWASAIYVENSLEELTSYSAGQTIPPQLRTSPEETISTPISFQPLSRDKSMFYDNPNSVPMPSIETASASLIIYNAVDQHISCLATGSIPPPATVESDIGAGPSPRQNEEPSANEPAMAELSIDEPQSRPGPPITGELQDNAVSNTKKSCLKCDTCGKEYKVRKDFYQKHIAKCAENKV